MTGEKRQQEYMREGMKRLLRYPDCLAKDNDLRKMCGICEKWGGDENDYKECTTCQAFKFYCELEQYRFAATFD